MPATILDHLSSELADVSIARPIGWVASVGRNVITVEGLSRSAHLGCRVSFGDSGQFGEVVAIEGESVAVLAEDGAEGLKLGDDVYLEAPARLWPDDTWLGRVIDPSGRPLDGLGLRRGALGRPLSADPPAAAKRRGLGRRVSTGLALFDTLLPIVRGQRIGLFAGAGVGKSTLLARLATEIDADVIVFALVGERGRELREFTERVLGPDGMKRTVVVAATADRAPLERRRAADAGMAVAEHFRDQGRHVLLLVDSVTRYAEAHREIAVSVGEGAAMRGHPPSMAARVMSLAERAGPGDEDAGDITAIFSVLVAGSDMDEPVADTLRGVLDGHVVLDRRIAERGRFPAVDVGRSVSRALPQAASAEENAIISRARELLGVYERSEMMIRAGLYVPGSDAEVDAAIAVWPALDRFFASRAPGDANASFTALAACLTASGEEAADADAALEDR